MKITFLIGNGFDLNCGLKSSFMDVYQQYVKKDVISNPIKQFKESISGDIDLWSDFEVAMANYMGEFDSERDFLICLRDFKSFLKNYLKEEESTFSKRYNSYQVQNAIKQEMELSFRSFYKGITNNLENAISKRLFKGGIYNAICFNYTNVFDHLAGITDEFIGSTIIHIHGYVDDLVLGMDNEGQLRKNFRTGEMTHRSKRAFLKPVFNKEYDENRTEMAIKMINESDIICVYGMSLGESDLTWRNTIFDWLASDEQRQLFIYDYHDSCRTYSTVDERLDIEEESKNFKLLQLNLLPGDFMEYFDRVHIPCGKNIFNIDKVINEATEKLKEEEKKKEEIRKNMASRPAEIGVGR